MQESMPACLVMEKLVNLRICLHANDALLNDLSSVSQICSGELRTCCDACHGEIGGPLSVTNKHG